jgi:hypothetical protein
MLARSHRPGTVGTHARAGSFLFRPERRSGKDSGRLLGTLFLVAILLIAVFHVTWGFHVVWDLMMWRL